MRMIFLQSRRWWTKWACSNTGEVQALMYTILMDIMIITMALCFQVPDTLSALIWKSGEMALCWFFRPKSIRSHWIRFNRFPSFLIRWKSPLTGEKSWESIRSVIWMTRFDRGNLMSLCWYRRHCRSEESVRSHRTLYRVEALSSLWSQARLPQERRPFRTDYPYSLGHMDWHRIRLR